MSENNKKIVDVGAVIDSANFFWVPFGIAVMMIIIMLTDGFDLFTMGYVGPHIMDQWHLAAADLKNVNQNGLIGMAVGSVGLGWFGDRVGRKIAYITCLALLFAGSILCYYAPDINSLAWWRLVTGFGLGGVTPLATTLIAEWTSKKVRSVVVALVIVAVPLGGSITGFIEGWLVPQYGWKSMFLVGAVIPLILFVLFGYLLPESPKYMAKHPSQHPKLARALNRLLGEQRFDGTENFVAAEAGKQSRAWFVTIWNSTYWKRTLPIWIAFTVNSFVLYVFTNYLRVLLQAANIDATVASRGLSMFSGGAVLGSIGGALLIGWMGSRYIGTALAFMGVIATLVIGALLSGANVSTVQLLTLCLLGGASVNGMQAFMYAVSAHSYPTEIRGAAVGMGQTVSRIGAVLSPWTVAVYDRMDPKPSVTSFLVFIAAVMMATVVSFFLIPSHIPRNKE
jgi:MFS transporter, AAHS family, 4-hydroxybenzoate transporter